MKGAEPDGESAHQRIHEDQSNLIPLDPQAFIEKALDLLASGRYLEKGMGLMALTGRRPAEIFFSASFTVALSIRSSSPLVEMPASRIIGRIRFTVNDCAAFQSGTTIKLGAGSTADQYKSEFRINSVL